MRGSVTGAFLGAFLALGVAAVGTAAPFQPGDPKYPNEWYARLPESSSATGVLNLPQAWGISRGSSSVKVAILDSGVITTAPDLIGRVLPALSANPSYPNGFSDATLLSTSALRHGTWVASVAAMGIDNLEGGAGIGNFSILPVTVTGTDGRNSGFWIAAGITMAAEAGAKVINISQSTTLYSELDTAARYAKTKGALVFVAAGNDDARKDMTGYDNLIFVSGTREDDTRWGSVAGDGGGSTWGPFVDISAPAHNILVEDPTSPTGCGLISGTSFAAPMVAGAAALAWSINPSLTPDQVRQMLFDTAKDLGTPKWDEVYGWGRLDVGALAEAAYASLPEPATLGLLGLGLAMMLVRSRGCKTAMLIVAALAAAGFAAPASADTFVPNDTLYAPYQWYAHASADPNAAGRLGLPRAWSYSLGSPSVKVAVIDTGVMISTPDLQGRLLPAVSVTGQDPFTDEVLAATDALQHGTWMASVIAMNINNTEGGAGVGRFSILPITDTTDLGYASPTSIAAGITKAVDLGAKVISVSQVSEEYAPVEQAATYARANGALVFIAAGNDNVWREFPVDGEEMAFPNLIFVSGTDAADARWGTTGTHGGTTYGPWVDISAPAASILAANPAWADEYGLGYGTSFATALVAGAAALAWSIDPDLSPDALEELLYATAKNLGAQGKDDEFGYGRLDIGALAAAAAPEPATLALVGLGAAALAGRWRGRVRVGPSRPI